MNWNFQKILTKDPSFYKHPSAGPSEKYSMYCVIKCTVRGNQARVKNADASSVLHSCNVKTQICVTRPQCVKCESWLSTRDVAIRLLLSVLSRSSLPFRFTECGNPITHIQCYTWCERGVRLSVHWRFLFCGVMWLKLAANWRNVALMENAGRMFLPNTENSCTDDGSEAPTLATR